MSAATIILVILLILLSILIGMIKFTKIGQKWFCPDSSSTSPTTSPAKI